MFMPNFLFVFSASFTFVRIPPHVLFVMHHVTSLFNI